MTKDELAARLRAVAAERDEYMLSTLVVDDLCRMLALDRRGTYVDELCDCLECIADMVDALDAPDPAWERVRELWPTWESGAPVMAGDYIIDKCGERAMVFGITANDDGSCTIYADRCEDGMFEDFCVKPDERIRRPTGAWGEPLKPPEPICGPDSDSRDQVTEDADATPQMATLDAEGVPVEVGGTYWWHGERVTLLWTYGDSERSWVTVRREDGTNHSAISSLLTHTPPDPRPDATAAPAKRQPATTFEQRMAVYKDSSKDECEYWRGADDRRDMCDGCILETRETGVDCSDLMQADLTQRLVEAGERDLRA